MASPAPMDNLLRSLWADMTSAKPPQKPESLIMRCS